MSVEERDLMKHIDEIILSASAKHLAELRELDVKTQMSGITFYENVVNVGALETRGEIRAKNTK